MLSFAAARALVAERVARTVAAESVGLGEAPGRVLASGVRAPRDVPGFVHSAMDGYAVRASDLREGDVELHCIGVALAGVDVTLAPAVGECVRITTGAPLPPGTDTVVIKEHSRVDGDRVRLLAPFPAAGGNVRRADDDWRAGDEAMAAGLRLAPAHIGVLASFGADRVDVRRRVRVATLATGDELIAPGAPWKNGRRYDSNGPVLAALCAAHGAEVVRRERVRDDPGALRAALESAARDADIVLSTGGVSAGEADYLPSLLAATGTTWFWKVAMRPGMPVLAGQVGDAVVFGLPGNPVSVIATFCALVRPALARLAGCAAFDPPARVARLAHDVAKSHERLELRRGTLTVDSDGVVVVATHASVSSGALRSVAESDVLVELAADGREWRAGDRVPTYPLQP